MKSEHASEFFFFLSEEAAVVYSRHCRKLRKQGKRPGVVNASVAAFGRKCGELHHRFKP